MDPLTLGAIATTLIKSGPDLIRGIGSFFGASSEATVNKVADLVDMATGQTNPEAALRQALVKLDPVQILQLENIARECQVELARIEAEREIQIHGQMQQTIQNGDNASDAYVRQTRPYMARLAGYGTGLYVIGLDAAAAFSHGTGASWDMAMLLVSPLLAYMGLREIGKWRQGMSTAGGATGLASGIAGLGQLFKRKQ